MLDHDFVKYARQRGMRAKNIEIPEPKFIATQKEHKSTVG